MPIDVQELGVDESMGAEFSKEELEGNIPDSFWKAVVVLDN